MNRRKSGDERPLGLLITALLLLLIVAFSVIMILEVLFPR